LASLVALPILSVTLPEWRLAVLPQKLGSVAALAAAGQASGLPEGGQAAPTAPAASAEPVGFERESLAAGARQAGVHWSVWILGVWAVGALTVMGLFLAGTVVVWRVARAGKPVREGSLWGTALQALGAMRELSGLRVLESERVGVPMMWGLFRPVVLLPAETPHWFEERRRIVIIHELAHLERGDCWTQAIAQLACAVHWFNPLAWLAARRMRVERERACDDRVLNAGLRASDYASHLLEIARSMRDVRCSGLAAVAMARPSQLEGRLLAILDAKRSRRALSRYALAVALLFAACAVPSLAAMQLTPVPEHAESAAAADGSAPELDVAHWINSEPLSLGALAGKAVVVEFWEMNRGPCRRDIPALNWIQEISSSYPVAVIAVHCPTDNAAAVKDLVAKAQITYPVCIDRAGAGSGLFGGRTFEQFGIEEVPATVLIDVRGRVHPGISLRDKEGMKGLLGLASKDGEHATAR
jgi:beta-lactamase regulating signal transducer with metallopeptidase domain